MSPVHISKQVLSRLHVDTWCGEMEHMAVGLWTFERSDDKDYCKDCCRAIKRATAKNLWINATIVQRRIAFTFPDYKVEELNK